jgi:hypothetical protein
MTTDELLELFRSEIDDKETPYLWSDSEIYGSMDDAQKTFCRKTEGIEDARTLSVCQIQVVAGTEWYAKSPLIRKVRSCSRADSGKAVVVMTPENAALATLEWRAGNTGPIKVLVDGQSKGFFRIYPMPSETVNLNLTVFRLPLATITDDGGQEFEIDDEHVPYLMDWMKHRAYRKHVRRARQRGGQGAVRAVLQGRQDRAGPHPPADRRDAVRRHSDVHQRHGG